LPARRFVHTTTGEIAAMATSLRGLGAAATGSATQHLALVLNDNAGAVLAGAATPDLMREKLQGGDFTIVDTPPGRLPDRLRHAAAAADTVVVAGGDGTVACAAAVLAGTDRTLGILPCGTMNLLARDLALPLDNLDAAAQIILQGHTRDIDVGMAGGNTFLCACMLGSPVRLGRHREQARRHGRLGQWLQFARAALLVLRRPRRMRLQLEVDGQVHTLRTESLTITLGALTDECSRMFGRDVLDEGKLTAYAVRKRGAFGMLRVFWRMAQGRPKDPALTVLKGEHISINAAAGKLHVMVDGEVELLATPVQFTVRPRALRVLAPPGRITPRLETPSGAP
jgi:diacylglycerol kinase family enzyme